MTLFFAYNIKFMINEWHCFFRSLLLFSNTHLSSQNRCNGALKRIRERHCSKLEDLVSVSFSCARKRKRLVSISPSNSYMPQQLHAFINCCHESLIIAP